MIISKERFELLVSDLDRLKTDLNHIAEMLSVMTFAKNCWIESRRKENGESASYSPSTYPMLSALVSTRDLSIELVDEVTAMTTTLLNEVTTSRREQFEGHDPTEFMFDPDHTPAPGEPGCIRQAVTRKKGNKPEQAGK